MKQMKKKLFFFFFLILQIYSVSCFICYACNSNWEACGVFPNLALIRYNKEICRGPCRVWKAENKIYRGCSNHFLPDNASLFIDQNGIIYKYCYHDLCNVNYEELQSTEYVTSKVTVTSTVTTTFSNDLKMVQCYFCNERWKACADPTELKEIKFSIVECQGMCVTWLNQLDNNLLYRGCLKNTSSLEILNKSKDLVYYVCSTDFCNDVPLDITSSTTINLSTSTVTEMSKNNSNFWIQGEGRAILKSNLSELDVNYHEYNDEYETEIENCDNQDSENYYDINVELEIESTISLVNSTNTLEYINKSETKSITCYFCNARWPECGNPPNLEKIKHNTVECVGVCVSWYNPWDKNLLYRGCSTQIINGTSGIYFDKNGLIYNYCSTNLCNIDAGISMITYLKEKANDLTEKNSIPFEKESLKNIEKKYLVTYQEFTNAVTKAGYDLPKYEIYINFVSQLEFQGNIRTKREAAMFLAQILWESDGLKATEEYACIKTECPGMYGTSRYIGKNYYGRGYIQLSWHYNYEAASRAIFGDDRLLKEPDLVSKKDEYAWATALWFWRTNVGTRAEVKRGYFGSSTMAINGGLECNGPHKIKAIKRFKIYKIILKEFQVKENPIENGCYN